MDKTVNIVQYREFVSDFQINRLEFSFFSGNFQQNGYTEDPAL